MDLSNQKVRAVPKPGKSVRMKPTQRQMGEISSKVDAEVKERSQGICEKCGKARATERAHLTGRKQIDHKTTANDIVHLCTKCHDWLDETEHGIQVRRMMAEQINYALRSGGS